MMANYPKTKIQLTPWKMSNRIIRFGGYQYGIAREIESDDIDVIWDLMKYMDGTKSINEITQYFSVNYNLKPEETMTIIYSLQKNGCLEDATNKLDFSEEEIERYDRNITLFSWIDRSSRTNHWEIQKSLKDAKVTIIGLGGVGSNCVSSLTRLGVGYLRIVDFDKVELSNLNRQVLFDESDIGKLKVQAAIEHLKKINHNINIEGINKKVTDAYDVENLISDVDLVILCADYPRFLIDRMVNRVSKKLNIPWIQGSYASTVVNCSLIVPGKSPCWECIYLKEMESLEFSSGFEAEKLWGITNAVTAPVAALTGNLAAITASNYLTGLLNPEISNIFQLDLYTMEQQQINRDFYPGCPVCNNPLNLLEPEKAMERNF